MELAPDGTAAVVGFQQYMDGGVPGSDAVGEPVALPGGGKLFGRSGLDALFLSWFGDDDAQALAVAGDGPFGGLAEVVPMVPAVSNLGRPGCGTLRKERSPVPADHFDP
ncbi:hypothetical protein [Streptomyces sp. NPDC001933]|uniref:hypothetical protein n=1 Tax=Streptomyces sp. NPDC001933 TaxID=3364626 RepID=UPI00369244F0